MRIIGKGRLHSFSAKYPDCRTWVVNWLADAECSSWTTPQSIKERYSTASFLASNVVIFNVRGNNYRLEVCIAYQTLTVLIVWVGTHADYARRHHR